MASNFSQIDSSAQDAIGSKVNLDLRSENSLQLHSAQQPDKNIIKTKDLGVVPNVFGVAPVQFDANNFLSVSQENVPLIQKHNSLTQMLG